MLHCLSEPSECRANSDRLFHLQTALKVAGHANFDELKQRSRRLNDFPFVPKGELLARKNCIVQECLATDRERDKPGRMWPVIWGTACNGNYSSIEVPDEA